VYLFGVFILFYAFGIKKFALPLIIMHLQPRFILLHQNKHLRLFAFIDYLVHNLS